MASHYFTVAIPTFNGAQRLPQVLDALENQVGADKFIWDVLVVDNNSTDQTKQVIQGYQERWKAFSRELNYALEPQQGAAFARQRAINFAQGQWVICFDDDVIPASDWLLAAYQFSQTHSHAGVYGGRIKGRFAVAPPQDFKRISSFLALRERGDNPHRYRPDQLSLPPSAAWVVNRTAWLACVPPEPTLTGRTSYSVMQGDDYEPLMYLHREGWEIWYAPDLSAEHLIPASRFERDYLLKLSRGCGLCVYALRIIPAKPWQVPGVFAKVLLGGLKRSFLHKIKYYHELNTKSIENTVAECELAFFVSSAISPFHYLMNILPKTIVARSQAKS